MSIVLITKIVLCLVAMLLILSTIFITSDFIAERREKREASSAKEKHEEQLRELSEIKDERERLRTSIKNK